MNVHFLIIVLILTLLNISNPFFVILIPSDGLPEPFFKRSYRTPPQLILYFTRINRVTPVMSRAVFHKCDERLRLVKYFQNQASHLQILVFVASTDIINLSGLPSVQYQVNSSAVVFHIKPVANMTTVSINRQGLIVHRVRNEEWK